MQSVICPKCGKEVPFANVVPSQCHHCLAKIKVKDNAEDAQPAEKPDEPNQGATTSLTQIKDHSRKSRLGKAVQIREAADRIREKQDLLREERNRKQYPCGACGVMYSEQNIQDKLAVIDDNESLYCPQHIPTLKKCPDCSREVSRNAATCPNCAAPIRGRRSRQVIISPNIRNSNRSTGIKIVAIVCAIVLAVGVLIWTLQERTAVQTTKGGSNITAQPIQDPGKVKGKITWQFNEFRGTKGDTGAIVLLLPAKYKGVKQRAPFGGSDLGELERSGFSGTQCGGDGEFTFNRVPAGDYTIFVISANTRTILDTFGSKDKLINLMVQKNKMEVEQQKIILSQWFDVNSLDLVWAINATTSKKITVLSGETFEFFHDFGYTDW